MAKPIFIIFLPKSFSQESISDLKRKKIMLEIAGDYHVLLVGSNKLEDVEFKVFYEKDFDEVKYEELKKIVEDSCKPQTDIYECKICNEMFGNLKDLQDHICEREIEQG